MKCGMIRKQLDAYIDGQLPLSERETVEEHLRACSVCRELVQQSSRLSELLTSVPVSEIPNDLAFRIHTMVQNRHRSGIWSQRAVILGAWWREASIPMRAAASFMLVFALTVGTLMSWRITQHTLPPADSVLDYGLNSFAGAPDGSLEQAYLTLLDSSTEARP